MTEYTPPHTSHFAPLPHACTCTLPHTLHLHFAPCLYFALCLHLQLAPFAPLPIYYLASLSGCIQLDSLLFHSFSLIITTSPIHIPHSWTLTHVHVCTHTTPLLFSPLHPCIETVPYPLIAPSEPYRAFVVIKPHSSYFMITAVS